MEMIEFKQLLLFDGSYIFCMLFFLSVTLTNLTIQRVIDSTPELEDIQAVWAKLGFPFTFAYKLNIPPYTLKEDIPTFLYKFGTGERKIVPKSYMVRGVVGFWIVMACSGLIAAESYLRVNSIILLCFTTWLIYLCFKVSNLFFKSD